MAKEQKAGHVEKHVKRRRIYAKTKMSCNKNSKNYVKKYQGQG